MNAKQMLKSAAKVALPAPARLALRSFQRRMVRPIVPGLVDRYCTGNGLEIGAGLIPYCPRSRTTFLDKNEGVKEATENADILADAWEIPRSDAAFEFVFSSHVLEHMPNAIRALKEWVRVLKPGGILFTMLPHAAKTIDKHRPITTLQHLIDDEVANVGHDDRTHFEDMRAGWTALAEYDGGEQFRREWGADPWDWEFRIKHGILHYHVWTETEIVELYRHLGLEIVEVRGEVPERRDTFLVIGRKKSTST